MDAVAVVVAAAVRREFAERKFVARGEYAAIASEDAALANAVADVDAALAVAGIDAALANALADEDAALADTVADAVASEDSALAVEDAAIVANKDGAIVVDEHGAIIACSTADAAIVSAAAAVSHKVAGGKFARGEDFAGKGATIAGAIASAIAGEDSAFAGPLAGEDHALASEEATVVAGEDAAIIAGEDAAGIAGKDAAVIASKDAAIIAGANACEDAPIITGANSCKDAGTICRDAPAVVLGAGAIGSSPAADGVEAVCWEGEVKGIE